MENNTNNMKTLLWLDDERNPLDEQWIKRYAIKPPVNVVWVKSYFQFTNWIIKNGLPDAINFDHDLADVFQLKETLDIHEWFDVDGNREYTGMNCAQWLVNFCMDNKIKLPSFIVHSANPCGRDNIEGLLNNYLKYEDSINFGHA